jgi:hypothetical protein
MRETTKTVTLAAWTLGLVGTVLFGCAASAQLAPEQDPVAPAEEPDTLEVLLSYHHGLPAREALDELPDVRARLWAVVLSPDAMSLHRERALLCLGYWPDARLRDFLEATLDGSDGTVMWHHDAVALYGRHWTDGDAIGRLAGLLHHADDQLAISAAHALDAMGTDAAQAALAGAESEGLSAPVARALMRLRGNAP